MSITNTGREINKEIPCKAIDVETKTLIRIFASRIEATKYFNLKSEMRVVNSINNRGACKINGKWIAFRNHYDSLPPQN